MFYEGLACIISSSKDVDYSVRDAGFFDQLGEHESSQRRSRGRLQNDRATGSQCWSNLPARHVQRIIPWRDLSYHSNRFAPINGCVAGHKLACMRSMSITGDCGKKSKVIYSERDITC